VQVTLPLWGLSKPPATPVVMTLNSAFLLERPRNIPAFFLFVLCKSSHYELILSPFLLAQERRRKKGHPAKIFFRCARSASVHFRNLPIDLSLSLSPLLQGEDGVRMGIGHSGFGHLKCLTLGLGRTTEIFAWGYPPNPHVPGAALRPALT
jgi:hypothetical protein